MPRVSDEHRSARRLQILEAAWRCFARDGFHGTSMQDIFAESGLSAGAVYRYFPGKIDLVKATAEGITRGVTDAFDVLDAADPVPHPDEALGTVLDTMLGVVQAGEVDLTRVAIHVWSEALREPDVATVVREVGMYVRRRWYAVAERWKAAGHIAPESDPEDLARLYYGVMAGFLLQRNVVGDVTPAQYIAGISALTGRSGTAAPSASRE